jgi:hypothetical protein
MRKNHLETKKFWPKKSKFWPIVKVANGQNLLITLFSATMGQKYVKLKSKACRKQLIYCESLQKFALWADFSKTASAAILKISVLETRDHP